MTDFGNGGRADARRSGDSVPAQADDSMYGSASGGRAAARRAGRQGGGKGSVSRSKRTIKILSIGTAGLLVVAVGGGVYAYEKLNGNIKSSALFSGTSGDAGKEKVDAFGRSPIDMLVIGSDGRNNAADCRIGGDCGPGANADVEMVVHISADRSNATVMSIPRDLMTQIPSCKDEKGATHDSTFDMINSALQHGPGCSVAAVHALTGIPISHFAMIDFNGVVSMSDAVGGVAVCVDNNVYDPDSHLKLTKGQHTLKGMSALEFLRTRHGFDDGGDVGRTNTQHMFISRMVNTLKSAGTFTDPTKMWSLANAATGALTVDDGLKSITSLLGLADDLKKVPSDRITFTTMQTGPYPKNINRLVIAPGAQTLFNTIINDQSLTTDSGAKTGGGAGTGAAAPTSAAPTKPATAPSEITVHVQNGILTKGRATTVQQALVQKGFSSQSTIGNAPSDHVAGSSITYGPGRLADAQEVAAAVGMPASALKQGTGSGIVLVIGKDWPTGATFPGGTAAAPPANTKVALNNAHVQTGDQNSSCAHVSTYNTIPVTPRYGITPTQAFSRHPEVPNSAP